MTEKRSRGAETRGRLVEAATALFVADGFETTSIEAVLAATGVSRGALYHHFPSKEALFTAVLETTEAHVTATVIAAASGAHDPLTALRLGSRAWLALARDPVVAAIVLEAAPSVLGWSAWREMERRHAFGLLRAAFGAGVAAGRIPPERADLYAHVLLASLTELSLVVARAADADRALAAAAEIVETVLTGFFGA